MSGVSVCLLKVTRPFRFYQRRSEGAHTRKHTGVTTEMDWEWECVCSQGADCVYPCHVGEEMQCNSLMCVYSVLVGWPFITATHNMSNCSLLLQMTSTCRRHVGNNEKTWMRRRAEQTNKTGISQYGNEANRDKKTHIQTFTVKSLLFSTLQTLPSLQRWISVWQFSHQTAILPWAQM